MPSDPDMLAAVEKLAAAAQTPGATVTLSQQEANLVMRAFIGYTRALEHVYDTVHFLVDMPCRPGSGCAEECEGCPDDPASMN